MPVAIDPASGLQSIKDPVQKLLSAVQTQRFREENLRLAYVAITRAQASVVMALPNVAPGGVQPQLLEAWSPSSRCVPGGPGAFRRVEVVPFQEPEESKRPLLGMVKPRDGAVLESAVWTPRSWRRQAPSGVHGELDRAAQLAVGCRIAAEALGAATVAEARYPWVATPAMPGLGGPGHDSGREDIWGTLMHGWLEAWKFRGPLDQDRVAAYLRRDWRDTNPVVVTWLLEVSRAMEAHSDSPLWQLVTDPAVELHPELPLTGLAADDRLLLSGRVDLLVRDARRPPRERWIVVDYKAGKVYPGRGHAEPAQDAPRAPDDPLSLLVEEARLDHYGPQLEAYRDMIDQALRRSPGFEGEAVGQLALWFVRAGAHVIWRGRA